MNTRYGAYAIMGPVGSLLEGPFDVTYRSLSRVSRGDPCLPASAGTARGNATVSSPTASPNIGFELLL
jgi:hypothetical protein